VTVVHWHSNVGEPRRVEIAPALVTVADDRRSCRLQIEHPYAQQHLDGRSFDLYIRLRCDVIADERGLPVDGNLLARYEDGTYIVDGPTGDGIPGGLFESWIHVRMSARRP
jgi:hypothetical protein